MKFRSYVAIRFTTEVTVEAASEDEAIRKIKEMDGHQLLENAGAPSVEVEDITTAARTKRRPR